MARLISAIDSNLWGLKPGKANVQSGWGTSEFKCPQSLLVFKWQNDPLHQQRNLLGNSGVSVNILIFQVKT